MENICEKLVRCLCSCLINKTEVAYSEGNEERHKFMPISDSIEDEHKHNKSLAEKQSISDGSTGITNKLSQFLTEDISTTLSEKPSSQSYASMGDADQHEEQSLIVAAPPQQLDYSQVISEDHPYYHIFADKLHLLPNIFDIDFGLEEVKPDTAYPLRMYSSQENKLNTFKYFFRFPCDYETYESLSNNFQLQKNFDSNIDEFKKILQTPEGDAKLLYLSYKKILMVSSRDFEYVRYTFKKGNQYWNICSSDLSREEIPGKVRGEMKLTVTRIVQVGNEIEVSVSSQIDMKMALKPQITRNRGFAQIRKYLEKVYKHIQTTKAANSEKQSFY